MAGGDGAARAASMGPPVGGWDTRHTLADMPAANAVTLDNWFPEADRVRVRPGYATWATGLGGAVETLIPYAAPSGLSQLFAVAGGTIYDATASGPAPSVVTGLSNSRWQYEQITTPGGQFVIAVNGADAPRRYDGTSWTVAAITGPAPEKLAWINQHQKRLWFGEAGSLKAWYLGINGIAGAAQPFELAGLARLGGYLVGMGTWTRDGGSGPDDVAVFLTSEGEVFVYAGTDPANASTWGLQGIFRIGRPLGRRCMIRFGADLVVITQDGFVPLSSVLPVDRSQQNAAAVSAQINAAVTQAARTYAAAFGWEPFLYPRANMGIFNVPAEAGGFDQYVFNTLTRAPCRFRGIPARCWGLLGDVAFFGGQGKVFRFDTGASDDGTNIQAYAVQAFSGFGAAALKKAFKRVQTIMYSEAPPTLGVDMVMDYAVQAPPPAPVQQAVSIARWDEAVWDQAVWAGEAVWDGWRGVRGVGFAAALRVQAATNGAPVSWMASRLLMVPGGAL